MLTNRPLDFTVYGIFQCVAYLTAYHSMDIMVVAHQLYDDLRNVRRLRTTSTTLEYIFLVLLIADVPDHRMEAVGDHVKV